MQVRLAGKILCFLLVLVVMASAEQSFAQVPSDNIIDQIGLEFQTSATSWASILQDYARRLFWILVGISFTAQALKLALKGGDFGDFLEFMVFRVLTIGFFVLLLENSSAWAQLIVDSMRQAGSQASIAGGGLAGINPSNIFDSGLQLAGVILSEVSFWTPGDSLGLLLSGLLLVVVFALIAAEMLFLLVQMYVVINAGVILTGFGGAHWTQGIAINFLRSALSTGIQLFLMQLVVGLGQSLILRWVAQFQQNNSQVLTIVGVAVVFLVLATKIPAMASSLVQGGLSVGGMSAGNVATGFLAGARTAGSMAGAATRTATTQATGGAALAYEMAKSSSRPSGGAPSSSMKAGGSPVSTNSSGASSSANRQAPPVPSWFKAAPLPRAVAQELSDRGAGRSSPRGSTMGRIAAHMRDERKSQEKDSQNQIVPTGKEAKSK